MIIKKNGGRFKYNGEEIISIDANKSTWTTTLNCTWEDFKNGKLHLEINAYEYDTNSPYNLSYKLSYNDKGKCKITLYAGTHDKIILCSIMKFKEE